MKRFKKFGLITLILAVLVSVGLYVPVWIDDAEARRNRARVKELVSLGQDLDEAQRALRDAGFRLSYDEPIKPTVNQDYQQQLVIVGKTQPNAFETFAYAAGLSWRPFTHSESPYVIINASLDGRITNID